MAKSTGIGFTNCRVDTAALALTEIRTTVTGLDWATPRIPETITSIELSAMERLLLLADFSINLSMNVDDTVNLPVFRSLNTGIIRRTTLVVNGSTLAITGILYTSFSVTRAANAALTSKATGVLADGSVPTWT